MYAAVLVCADPRARDRAGSVMNHERGRMCQTQRLRYRCVVWRLIESCVYFLYNISSPVCVVTPGLVRATAAHSLCIYQTAMTQMCRPILIN